MSRAALLMFLLTACAHRQGGPSDSPQWLSCKAYCAEQGNGEAKQVVESAASFDCYCDEQPEHDASNWPSYVRPTFAPWTYKYLLRRPA